MELLKDIHQVKAFLGCCQQMAGYVKEYAILAAPLHKLTKKATVFPKPWTQGSDYDLALRIYCWTRIYTCIIRTLMKCCSSK